MSETSREVGNAIMRFEGVMVLVVDAKSPMCRTTMFREAWDALPEDDLKLWRLNSFFGDGMARFECLAWILVLMGTCRLRVRLHESRESYPTATAQFVGLLDSSVIECPSGELMWQALDTGEPFERLATVPPGRYECRLTGMENPDHWDIFSAADYPQDGEDWTLHLLRVNSSPADHVVT